MLISFKTIVEKYGKPKGIVHVGASSCEEAKEYYDNGVSNVFWVEALPNKYESSKEFLEKNYPSMHIVNACISSEAGKIVDFNITNNDGQSSSFLQLGTHKELHPTVVVEKIIQLTTTTLTHIIDQFFIDLENHNMLVMDIQGAEYLALQGLKREYMNKFKYIYLECNESEVYVGNGLLSEIKEYLLGWNLVEQKMAIAGAWGDCLFVKDENTF
jgi:FkbM family methyltransferase